MMNTADDYKEFDLGWILNNSNSNETMGIEFGGRRIGKGPFLKEEDSSRCKNHKIKEILETGEYSLFNNSRYVDSKNRTWVMNYERQGSIKGGLIGKIKAYLIHGHEEKKVSPKNTEILKLRGEYFYLEDGRIITYGQEILPCSLYIKKLQFCNLKIDKSIKFGSIPLIEKGCLKSHACSKFIIRNLRIQIDEKNEFLISKKDGCIYLLINGERLELSYGKIENHAEFNRVVKVAQDSIKVGSYGVYLDKYLFDVAEVNFKRFQQEWIWDTEEYFKKHGLNLKVE